MAYWGTPSHHNPRKQIGGQPPIVPYGEDEDTPAALRRVLRTPESPPSSPSNSFTKFLHSKELKLALVALLSLVLATISLYTIFSLSPASHASRFERPATGYPPVPSKASELSTAQVLADVTEKATATVHTEMLFQLQTELETRQLKNDAALAAGLAGVERKGEDRALALDVSLRAQADRIATLEKQLAAAQAAQPRRPGVGCARHPHANGRDARHAARHPRRRRRRRRSRRRRDRRRRGGHRHRRRRRRRPSRSRSSSTATHALGAEVHLYWLSGNATERLYARLPAGKRVYETTYAGQCWRARDPISGNHVASYCATAEPHQTVRLGASDDVDIDFHFARTRKLGQHARVVRVGPPSRVAGEVAQGAHLTVRAKAGERFKVVGSAAPTARAAAADATVVDAEIVLLEMTARAEAEQHVNIGSNVTLRFELPSGRGGGPRRLLGVGRCRLRGGAPVRQRGGGRHALGADGGGRRVDRPREGRRRGPPRRLHRRQGAARADRRAQARGGGAVGAVVAAHGGAAEGGDRAGVVARGHGRRQGRGEAEAVAAHAADGRKVSARGGGSPRAR